MMTFCLSKECGAWWWQGPELGVQGCLPVPALAWWALAGTGIAHLDWEGVGSSCVGPVPLTLGRTCSAAAW